MTIGDSVTSIGVAAFQYCTALQSVTIGDNVTTIGSSAFYQCSELQSVTMGDSVTSIGVMHLIDAVLQSMTIPNSVGIGDSAFGDVMHCSP